MPDPLVMFDGKRVTTKEGWKKRGLELRLFFQHYMYGVLPKRPKNVSAKVLHENRKALGGKATLKEIALAVGPADVPPIYLLLAVPNGRKGPAPAFVG